MSYKPGAAADGGLCTMPVAGSVSVIFASRNYGSCLVGDDAGDVGIGLRKYSYACQHEEQRQQKEPVFRLSHVTFLFKVVLLVFRTCVASPSGRYEAG